MITVVFIILPSLSAESKGFEPLVRAMRTTVFETAPFDRSGNSPVQSYKGFMS